MMTIADQFRTAAEKSTDLDAVIQQFVPEIDNFGNLNLSDSKIMLEFSDGSRILVPRPVRIRTKRVEA